MKLTKKQREDAIQILLIAGSGGPFANLYDIAKDLGIEDEPTISAAYAASGVVRNAAEASGGCLLWQYCDAEGALLLMEGREL